MKEEYLARSIMHLSGIPVRIYRGEEQLCVCFPAPLPRDPFVLCRDDVFALPEHVGYYATPLFHYYGVLNTGEFRLVIGPTSQIMADEQKLRELAFQLDVPQEEIPDFVEGMNAILRLPVETLLQMLCTLNYFLNGEETLELSDLAIHEAEQTLIKTGVERRRTTRVYENVAAETQEHNTLAIEEALMSIVRRGDSDMLRRWLSSAPAVHGGTIAGDQLRQLRNTFIVTATLASRAAIRGGMRQDDAFSLSDAYIRRVELLTSHSKIQNLQYHMLVEFTEQVEKLHRGKHTTRLSLDVANYVRHHLSEPIRVEAMAAELYISRPYLSDKFRRETGQTLTDYILEEKTEEAKRLLRYSDRSAAAIGTYLGFSSHGHFTRVFKKYAGITPGEYRAHLADRDA
ncbi:MAG: helix-turn-helix domain-containing protein [Lachnospiraceae bacterium]|nr:helix-turn-helix domain-containing protein [Lachnospiraceae bacterium]